MAKGYGRINHDFFDKLINKDLTRVERRIIDIIMRYSWFCDKNKEKLYAYIPNKNIFGKYKINNALDRLEKANAIMTIPNKKLYAINKYVETWDIPDLFDIKELELERKELKRLNLTELFDDIIANNKEFKEKIRNIKGVNPSEKQSKPSVKEDKIIMAGVETQNIQMRRSTVSLVKEYCKDQDALYEAMRDVSLDLESGKLKQNPDNIYVTIKKYYNQIIKNNTPKIKSKVSSGAMPARYDSYVFILAAKMKGFKIGKEEANELLIKQGEFTRENINSYLEYEKNN